MKKQDTVFLLTCKYEDNDVEVVGVCDSIYTLLSRFRWFLKHDCRFITSDERVSELCDDLMQTGPDDECAVNGCVFGWEKHKVHHKEEYDGEAKGDDSN